MPIGHNIEIVPFQLLNLLSEPSNFLCLFLPIGMGVIFNKSL